MLDHHLLQHRPLKGSDLCLFQIIEAFRLQRYGRRLSITNSADNAFDSFHSITMEGVGNEQFQ